MKLETERLVLKEIHEGHTEDILRIRSNEVINQYVKRNSPKNNYDALEFILHIKRKSQNKEIVFWGISYKNTPNLIGSVCLWNFSEDKKTAELGYELLPDHHRKGLMSEALTAVLNYGYNELQLLEVLAITSKLNENSKHLLLKHHFTLAEDKKDEDHPDNIIFRLKRN